MDNKNWVTVKLYFLSLFYSTTSVHWLISLVWFVSRPKDTYFTPSTLNMNYRSNIAKIAWPIVHWSSTPSLAGFELILARKMTFYVITYYLPSGLFVVVSWISFLVNPECIPGINLSLADNYFADFLKNDFICILKTSSGKRANANL